MLNRNNVIVALLIVLWVGTWAVQTDRVQLPWTVTQEVAVVAFVLDNDAPDIDLDVEVTKAVEILRERYDVVLKLDDTPESVQSIQQGPVIVSEADKYGGKSIVLLSPDDSVIRSVELPSKAEEMVRWVDAG